MIVNPTRYLADVSVAMTRNTFVGGELFLVVATAGATGATAKVPVVHMESSRNVWDGDVLLALTYGLRDQGEGDAAGKGAGPDGKDLGADGPGRSRSGLERWKQTPEYQRWLKDTIQEPAVGSAAPQQP